MTLDVPRGLVHDYRLSLRQDRRSQLTILRWLIWRDVTLLWRRRSEMLSAVAFFVMVVSLFPLGIGPDAQLLRSIATGVVWTGALLACSSSLRRLFDSDYRDGTLDQILLSPQPLYLIVLGKVAAQCIVSAVPLIAIAPFLALQLGASPQTAVTLVLSLALGVPALCFIGSIGAALTLGVRGSGFLLSALVLPLWVPVLIFGAGASLAPDENIALLAAVLILSAIFAPLAAAAALRLAAE